MLDSSEWITLPETSRDELGQSLNQLVDPKWLGQHLMSVNPESAFSGHLRAKKMEARILPNFFWPGLRQEVIRFCHSCDVCQRTIKKVP